MKTKHGVYVQYGQTSFKLSALELNIISDALEIINPDETERVKIARKLSSAFLALSQYARSVQLTGK
jgi:hypothetical protein